MKDIIRVALSMLLSLLFSAPLLAGPILVIDAASQKLTAAKGVVVDGLSYDVEFLDGTCQLLFAGCDEASDFIFGNDLNQHRLASTALMEQVFRDIPALGRFDSFPQLTEGCSDVTECSVLTPMYLNGNTVVAHAFINYVVDSFDDEILDQTFLASALGLEPFPAFTWAVWRPASTVPAPAVFWLGLPAMLLLLRRR